jgi:hypothetical protein
VDGWRRRGEGRLGGEGVEEGLKEKGWRKARRRREEG